MIIIIYTFIIALKVIVILLGSNLASIFERVILGYAYFLREQFLIIILESDTELRIF